jgi:DNA-binding protein H-NS
MKRDHLKAMSTDELWALHQEVTTLLAAKIVLEKGVLEDRLRQLNQPEDLKSGSTELKTSKSVSAKPPNGKSGRRAYPTVLPKYQNPAEPHETWSGRGKQPRWLMAQLSSGKQIEDFRFGSDQVDASTVPSEVGHVELRLASVR